MSQVESVIRATSSGPPPPPANQPVDGNEAVPSRLALLEYILSSTNDLISFIDRSYTYREVNGRYLQAFELDRDAVLGRTGAALFGEERFETQLKPSIDCALAGKTFQLNDWFDYPGLGKRFMEINYHPCHDDTGEVIGVVANAHDITERKNGNLALAHSQQRFRDFTELASDCHWEMGQDLRFTHFSDRLTALTGIRPEELVGNNGLDARYQEADPKLWRAHIEDLKAHREFHDFRFPFLTRDGKRMWLSASGKPLFSAQGTFQGYRGISRDVTAEVDALSALRESEERYRHLLETLNESISSADENSCYTYVNDRFCELLGYERESIIGRPIMDFVHESSREVFEQQRAQRRAGGARQYEIAWKANDGHPVHTLVSPGPVFDAEGNFKGSIAAMTDIRERKRQEAELRRKAEALEQSNRELEQFAFVASHDLQEPLRKVQAFGDRLEQQFSDGLGDRGQDYLGRMRSAAARMQILINDLLTFSRISTKGAGPVSTDLNTVVEQVIGDLEIRIAETGGEVHTSGLPVITADRSQMGQLFQNLIGNALKYRREEVTPMVQISSGPIDNEETGLDPTRGPYCRIEVADNGLGFESKFAEKIFGIFQRLHGRGHYEGTGVGLAVCKKICERHDGSISAASELGKGSVFVVTLPIHATERESDH